MRIQQAFSFLEEPWDYRYKVDSVHSALMEAWEFSISTYMHEAKITPVRLRNGILSYPNAENFLYKQVAKWAKEEQTYAVYCDTPQLMNWHQKSNFYKVRAGKRNTCQELLAFTLEKAIGDIEQRLGIFNGDNWRQDKLVQTKYEHPFGSWFGEIRLHDGNRRTPQMQMWFYHQEGQRYEARSGTNFRMIQDMSDSESSLYAMDVEPDQSRLWQSSGKDMTDLWNSNGYFKTPTFEVAGGPKFKLTETAKTVFLHPGDVSKK